MQHRSTKRTGYLLGLSVPLMVVGIYRVVSLLGPSFTLETLAFSLIQTEMGWALLCITATFATSTSHFTFPLIEEVLRQFILLLRHLDCLALPMSSLTWDPFVHWLFALDRGLEPETGADNPRWKCLRATKPLPNILPLSGLPWCFSNCKPDLALSVH
jgi:hypothetical protein